MNTRATAMQRRAFRRSTAFVKNRVHIKRGGLHMNTHLAIISQPL